MIKFAKYHGCGNDFIITVDDDVIAYRSDMPDLARRICNRSTGVGADGLIVLGRSPLYMSLWNADGSVAKMCGNGIRCVAAYCYDEELMPASVDNYTVETLAGKIGVEIIETDPFECKINIGTTEFFPDKTIELSDGSFVTANIIYNGTDHAVIFIEQEPWEYANTETPSSASLSSWAQSQDPCPLPFVVPEIVTSVGKQLDINVDFARRLTANVVQMITYERGVGITAACGTGACAVVAAGHKLGKLASDVSLRLPYGELKVQITEEGETYLTGPAQRVAIGKYY
jgi:diaminopimelate epimerase